MTNIEITKTERQHLSKETLLRWYRMQNKAKLKALQQEIIEAHKSGANDKIEKLREIIIENTKKELEKHKNLTVAQRNQKAKEFADKVIESGLRGKNIETIMETYMGSMMASSKDELLKVWIDKDPEVKDKPSLSPRYLAYQYFRNENYQKDAFLMFTLIEKKWDLQTAKNLWDEISSKYKLKNSVIENYAFSELRNFFSEENARDKLGFYYGTNVRSRKWCQENGEKLGMTYYSKWDPRAMHEQNSKYVTSNTKNWSSSDTYDVKGWWTYDENKGDYDEFTFTHSLHEAVGKINSELKDTKNYDSGIDPQDAKEIAGELVKANRIPKFRKGTMKRDLYEYFIVNRIKGTNHAKIFFNKWSPIMDEAALGKMVLLYGDKGFNFSDYKFRYFANEKKLYLVRLNSAGKDEKNFGGYIEVESSRLGELKMLNQEETKSKLKSVIGKMKDKDIKEEVNENRLQANESTYLEKLEATNGVCAHLNLHNTVAYSDLDEKYIGQLDKAKTLKGAIKAYLVKNNKLKRDIAEDLVNIRAEYVKTQIKEQIDGDEVMKDMLEDNPHENIKIGINSKDEITVSLTSFAAYKKRKKDLAKKLEDEEKAETSPEAIAKSKMERIEKKVRIFAGSLTPLVMWILKNVFKVTKYLGDKTSLVGGFIGGILGLSTGNKLLGSKKISTERFEKLIPKNKKQATTLRKMYFNEDVKLKGYKIIIPKGKGIIPGARFMVEFKGVGKNPVIPSKEKPNLISRIFSSASKYEYQDQKIIIHNLTTIPKGTVIPKGVKIVRV